MCLWVNDKLTEKKLKGVHPNHVFTFYKSLDIEGDKDFDEILVTPFQCVPIENRVVKVKNPIKRTQMIKEINGHALHLYTHRISSADHCGMILLPVKVLAKNVIKFGTDSEVCVSEYELSNKYAKRFHLKG